MLTRSQLCRLTLNKCCVVVVVVIYTFLIGHLSHMLPLKIYMPRVDMSSMYRLTSVRNRGEKGKCMG